MASYFFCSYFVSLTKKLFSSTTFALLDSVQWLSTEHNQGDSVHWFAEKHTCLSKNKGLFLNASSSRILAFSLVNAVQMWQLEWNSFLDLSLSTAWWLCVQSFFPYSHDDSLIPFFGFCSPLFPFQHFFQLSYSMFNGTHVFTINFNT